MQIELKKNINTKTIRFLGEVTIRDEQKFETYKDIIKRTMPSVILKLIEKFITQLGISNNKIKIAIITKPAKAISEIGLLGLGAFIITLLYKFQKHFVKPPIAF